VLTRCCARCALLCVTLLRLLWLVCAASALEFIILEGSRHALRDGPQHLGFLEVGGWSSGGVGVGWCGGETARRCQSYCCSWSRCQ
jgi:hypothetical protein